MYVLSFSTQFILFMTDPDGEDFVYQDDFYQKCLVKVTGWLDVVDKIRVQLA